jgi:hypothetical protein
MLPAEAFTSTADRIRKAKLLNPVQLVVAKIFRIRIGS